MESYLSYPGQQLMLQADDISSSTTLPAEPVAIDDLTDFNKCNWVCVLFFIFSSGLSVGHIWIMITQLHNWANGNFHLINLTIWTFFEFTIGTMYVAKIEKWFRAAKWIRIMTWVFSLCYSLLYFTAIIEVIIKVFKGNQPIDTHIEIITSYLMVLGFPAFFYSSIITIVEATNGDMNSEEAKRQYEADKAYKEWEE